MEIEEIKDVNLDTDTVCTICDAEFLDAEDLAVHLTQVHTSEPLMPTEPTFPVSLIPCHFCSCSVSDSESYACHIRDTHIESLQLCEYCSKAFIEVEDLIKHKRKHYCVNKRSKKCSQCPEEFENISQLEMHEYEQHNNSLDGILLQDYSPVFSSVLNIKFFPLIKSIGKNIDFLCISCHFKSNKLKSYVKHLQKHECRAFTCNNCSQTYKLKKTLFKHLQSMQCSIFTKKLEKLWECPSCFKKINSMFFNNHVKHCKPIKCTMCNVVFKTLNSLSEHQAKMHPTSLEVKLCKFCSRQCVGRKAFMKHMSRVHTQELHLYKYKCVQCCIVFKHPQKLFAHYFMNHKDLEPYTCKICDKKFRIRKKFTLHIKLDHKSVGFVEFDKDYHVFFSANKSESPFTPTCVIPEEELLMYKRYKDEDESKNIDTDENSHRKESKENLNLDTSQTEAEDHIAEGTVKRRKVLKRRTMLQRIIRKNPKKNTDVVSLDSSDDDKPLQALIKRKPIRRPINWLAKPSRVLKNNKKQLTCNKCDKYCYTFQNYQHHMSLHKKHERKSCIKCSKVFTSKDKLHKHIETEHSSSKLTETLRKLLEKRKRGETVEAKECSVSEKFIRTIKKFKQDYINNVTATLKPVQSDTSLQKFIENFTPESSDASKGNNINIQNNVIIKMTDSPFYRKPIIKMTKFVPKPISMDGKLTLPVKFKQDHEDKVIVTLKVVQTPKVVQPKFIPHEQSINEFLSDEYHYPDHLEEDNREDEIPEVAEEVFLEGTEETSKPMQIPHKIVLPKIPQGCPDISIAHLLPEAPYFKIVKVKDVINEEVAAPKPSKLEKKDVIKLPDGTKLVTVNPLAHLLGDKKIDQILEPIRNKYYKPKLGRNVENLFTKALEKANTYTNVRKNRTKLQNKKSEAQT